jgi:hypothetical protein
MLLAFAPPPVGPAELVPVGHEDDLPRPRHHGPLQRDLGRRGIGDLPPGRIPPALRKTWSAHTWRRARLSARRPASGRRGAAGADAEPDGEIAHSGRPGDTDTPHDLGMPGAPEHARIASVICAHN